MRGKLLGLFLGLITLVVFSGCFSDRISNTKDGQGELSISGVWPITTNSLTSSRAISSSASTITLTLTNTSTEEVVEKSVSKTANTTYFLIDFTELATGTWKVEGKATDSSGDSVGTIRTKKVLIVEGSNAFSAVFGPVTYSELYLDDSFYRLLGDYTHHFDAMSYLKVKKVEYYEGESFNYKNGNDYETISREEFERWQHFTNLENYTTESAIFMREEGLTPDWESSDVLATINYTYTGDKITSAVYTNDSTVDTSIVAGFTERNIKYTATVSYNSDDRISELNSSGSYTDTSSNTQTFGEVISANYSNGVLSSVSFEENNSSSESQSEGGTMTFTYDAGRLIATTESNESGQSYGDTIAWDLSAPNFIDVVTSTEEDEGETKTRTSTFNYDDENYKLDSISYKEGTNAKVKYFYYDEKTYTYDGEVNNNTNGHLSEIISTDLSTWLKLEFIYDSLNPDRVNEIRYFRSDGTLVNNKLSYELIFKDVITYND